MDHDFVEGSSKTMVGSISTSFLAYVNPDCVSVETCEDSSPIGYHEVGWELSGIVSATITPKTLPSMNLKWSKIESSAYGSAWAYKDIIK